MRSKIDMRTEEAEKTVRDVKAGDPAALIA